MKSVEISVTPPVNPEKTSFVKKPMLNDLKTRKKDIPRGLWTKCPSCGSLLHNKDLDENCKICTGCDYHFRSDGWARINALIEPDSFEELDPDLRSIDVLNFTGVASYSSKLEENRRKTGLNDAVITGIGEIGDIRTGIGVMDFSFLGGSMGSVVGEKLTRMIEKATEQRLPVIIVSASGGARMYEGMLSLMQMAKTCAALGYHSRMRLPYISVLTHPTTAGVMASYASVGDLILSEPGAMIGFAGPRVIKDTTQSELPAGFQTAEFLLERGLIDAIVHRRQMKRMLRTYLAYMIGNDNTAGR